MLNTITAPWPLPAVGMLSGPCGMFLVIWMFLPVDSLGRRCLAKLFELCGCVYTCFSVAMQEPQLRVDF